MPFKISGGTLDRGFAVKKPAIPLMKGLVIIHPQRHKKHQGNTRKAIRLAALVSSWSLRDFGFALGGVTPPTLTAGSDARGPAPSRAPARVRSGIAAATGRYGFLRVGRRCPATPDGCTRL